MKKLLILFLFTLSVTVLFTSCSSEGNEFKEKSYHSGETQISGVAVDVYNREIEVSLSEDAQIHIGYFESDKEHYDISVSDDDVLTMTAESDKDWTDYIGGDASAGANKISLQVPKELLSTLTLSTTKRDISLPALTVMDSVSLVSNGGNITFDKLDVGSVLTLENKNGDISGTIIGSYDDYSISCNVKKGESNLPADKSGGNKTLTVTNNNGNVNIEFAGE